MANLYEILDNANEGEAIATLGREFDLTPEQTQSAVAALLPAISSGLKQSTSTVDGLGNLFALMGQQRDLPALYDDAEIALKPQGLAAGNDALSVIFGSPQVTQAVVDQAQKFSGVSSSILQKMLPVLAGMILSGLMRSGSSAKPSAPVPSPSTGDMGGLGDILGQIFGRGTPGSSPAPAPSSGPGGLGDILGQIFGKGAAAGPAPSAPLPTPTDTGGPAGPSGDLLGTILRELAKGIQNGTIKPVIVGGGGPIQIPMPGGQDGSGSGAPQVPGGDVFGKILRDVLGGALGGGGGQPQAGPITTPTSTQAPTPPMKDLSDLTKQLGVMGGAGAAVFGDKLEHGQNVDQSHLDNIQGILDRSYGAERR